MYINDIQNTQSVAYPTNKFNDALISVSFCCNKLRISTTVSDLDLRQAAEDK